MGRLVTFGWELQSATTGVEFVTSGSPTISTTTVRTGSASGRCTSLVSTTPKTFILQYQATNTNDVYKRVYFRVHTAPSAENTIIMLANQATVSPATKCAYITIDNGRLLRLYDATGVQIGSASSALNADQWYRIELRYNPLGAGSTIITARIDGTNFATTTTGATANASLALHLGGNLLGEAQTTGDWFFDDGAVNDTAGTKQTSYPGAGNVIMLSPAAAGDVATFGTRVGGTAGSANDYTRLNDIPPDDATSYMASVTLNQEELLNCTASGLASNATINVVQVGLRSANITSADATTKLTTEIEKAPSGTISSSTAFAINSTTWSTRIRAAQAGVIVLYADPDGTGWTQATLDTMQIGFKLTTTSANKIGVTSIWAYVDYSDTTTQTTTGKARVQVTTLQTATGKARVQKSASQTATGIARLQKSVTKTITGVGRIQKSVSQTITGKSRIQKATSQTATGVARVQKSVSQTITGKSRIQKAVSQTITGIARITATTARTITGVARIQKSANQTITGVAKILIPTVDKDITGIARVQKSVAQTITGVGRITQTVAKTINGVARITQTVSQTITGKSRITAQTPQTITGKSRITATTSKTITGVADINNNTLQTIFGKGRIQKTVTQTIQGLARIGYITVKTLTGVARITATGTQNIFGKGDIKKTTTQTITGISRIQFTRTKTLTGQSRITDVTPQTLTGKALIVHPVIGTTVIPLVVPDAITIPLTVPSPITLPVGVPGAIVAATAQLEPINISLSVPDAITIPLIVPDAITIPLTVPDALEIPVISPS